MAKRKRSKSKSFSDQLREAIDEHELSRNAICNASGMDRALMSRFMAGTKRLTNDSIDKLWPVLNLKIEKK
jgi:hypothetical protein